MIQKNPLKFFILQGYRGADASGHFEEISSYLEKEDIQSVEEIIFFAKGDYIVSDALGREIKQLTHTSLYSKIMSTYKGVVGTIRSK